MIWLEQSGKPGYEQAQAIAQKKFDAVQKPFTYSFGVSPDAMDYQTLLSLLLTLLCAVIAAPVFASDAQTGGAGHPIVHKKRRSAASSGKASGGV